MLKDEGGPSAEHGEIVGKVVIQLGVFINQSETSLGKVYSGSATTLGRPKGSSFVKPDVSYVAAGRTQPKFRGPIPVAPDLVVEVNSPSDTTQGIHDKIVAYRETGVRLIWSIYLLEQFVVVYRSDDPDASFFNLKGELDGGDVLPGFKLAVKTLFE